MAYNGFSLVVPDGLDSKSMVKRHVDKLRRRVWLRRVCYALVLVGLAALVGLISFQLKQTPSDRSLLSLPSNNVPTSWSENATSGMYIEDVILMDLEVLMLVRKSSGSAFPFKQALECRYVDANMRFISVKSTALHLYPQRAAILCPAPPRSFHWDVNSVLIAVGQDQQILSKVTVHKRPLQWFHSEPVTYEAFPTETDMVVFVHGINHPRSSRLPAAKEVARLRTLACVYGGYFETEVTAQAQEVFRCAHPPADLVHQFAGRKISVKLQGRVLASVAYYNPGLNSPNPSPDPSSPELSSTPELSSDPSPESTPEHSPEDSPFEGVSRKLLAEAASTGTEPAPKHHVCSCTMIYNAAKFLKEWVHYNSHLGVTKFFLYDNNSDDDLDGVISSLESRGFTIQKQPWPWVKTQEAGFSHCSVAAQNECTWMLFTDVDEFFFPSKHFRENASSSSSSEGALGDADDEDDDDADADVDGAEVPAETISPPATPISPPPGPKNASILARFITAASLHRNRLGQICTFCYNFGPSGFRASPPQGVTQGYTCRLRKMERHKSLVLLSAVESSLENAIHHFTLKPGYGRKLVRPGTAVINHYKFQAWAEFKHKFHRRAATYVADWTEDRNHGSKDRVPDLGTKPVKPADWEARYCEVRDDWLRNYTRSVFGTYDREHKLHLPWE